MIMIREACLEDSSSIAHVEVESYRSTYANILKCDNLRTLDHNKRTGRWAGRLEEKGELTYVAEDTESVIGFINGSMGVESRASLNHLYLLSNWQHMGLGRKLLLEVVTTLIAMGKTSMDTEVLNKNEDSKSFFKNLGARRRRHIPRLV